MIALWLALSVTEAHPLAPSVLRLTETDTGIEATWRTPLARPRGSELLPLLPCEPDAPPVRGRVGEAIETTWQLPCRIDPTVSAGVSGIRRGGPTALVQWRKADGWSAVEVVRPDGAAVYPPVYREATVRGTIGLGAMHLFGGPDHIAFVCGLVLGVPVRRLVGAITAFTVGHAISLASVGLGAIALPGALVECAIALSIVWLAAELMGSDEDLETRWLFRYPAIACLPFGLVHGLGFAGAWMDSGVDPGTGLQALLGFNIGIELGQLAVVVVAWAALQWLGGPDRRVRLGLAALGGALGGLWAVERLVALLM